MMKNWRFISLSLLLVIGCNQKDTNVPVVGFVDAFEDNTIGQALYESLGYVRETMHWNRLVMKKKKVRSKSFIAMLRAIFLHLLK